jgi:hypothetical protein
VTPGLFVITGVSGTGKTAALHHLGGLLPRERFALERLDADGVPSGADDHWRRSRARTSSEAAREKARTGRSTVLEGSFQPADFKDETSTAAAAADLERVTGLGVDAFADATLAGQAGFARLLMDPRFAVCRIDTSGLSPQAVAGRVRDWIHSH